MIVSAFKTKTPFIVDSMVRAMVVMAAFFIVGGILVLADVPYFVANIAFVWGLFSMLPVMYLSLKQGERNRGPMPTLPPQA